MLPFGRTGGQCHVRAWIFAVILGITWGLVRVAGSKAEDTPPPQLTCVEISNAAQLREFFEGPVSNAKVILAAGEYHLEPIAAIDSTCGNCEDPDRTIPVTVGVRISGRDVYLEGPEQGEAVIHTNAGYGIFFERCQNCAIRGVTVTGGERDTAQAATDAAIVVKNSDVEIARNKIMDNIGDSTIVVRNIVGIIGVCIRENSLVGVVDNQIVRNSWDGIALYRDAQAVIQRNLIDGVDKARGGEAGGGRGVGIGVTWNAKATIEGNLVKRYWKGIGVFVDAEAEVRNNVVEEMLTWGIALWDAGKGNPSAVIEGNVIYDCGACGASITRETPLAGAEDRVRFVGNLLSRTGQNTKYDDPDYYCYQCALALHAVPSGAIIEDNLFFDNRRATDDLPDEDVSPGVFHEQKRKYLEVFFRPPTPEWMREKSDFLRTHAPTR